MAWKGLAIGRFKAVLTVLALTAGSSLLAAGLQPLLVEVLVQPDPVPAPAGARPAS